MATENIKDTEEFQLSERAWSLLQSTSSFYAYVQQVLGDSYDPTTNPDGIVNFGIAENTLCEDLIRTKMKSIQNKNENPKLFYYDVNSGNAESKRTGKKFLQNFFNPLEEIDERNIVIISGMTAALEILAFAVADSGEYIMVPSPVYFRIHKDIKERANVNPLSVHLQYKNDGRPSECILNSEILEEEYQRATEQGKVVKAILLSNPNNPGGDVLSEKQLLDILQFAYRRNLHVISNEIYALSVFDPDVKFTSLLSLPHPNPSMVHVTWGCSKDLSLAGYKFAIVYTRNPSVLAYCQSSSVFTTTSSIVQFRLQEILSDTEWLTKVFLPTKNQRMLDRYRETCKVLREQGAKIRDSGATLFVWMDLSEFLPERTFEAEHALFLKFMKEKVFLQPGKELYNKEPGMFRMVFTLGEKVFAEGMSRMLKTLNSIQRRSTLQQNA